MGKKVANLGNGGKNVLIGYCKDKNKKELHGYSPGQICSKQGYGLGINGAILFKKHVGKCK